MQPFIAMTPDPNKQITPSEADPGAASRKKDHIELALQSQVAAAVLDGRFYYEPMLAAHPQPGSLPGLSFLGKNLRTPVWVSSMTGGTEKARTINQNLARACAEFGMGMGLGSCRQLLYDRQYLPDFDVRDIIGDGLPLYANLGVAQVEQLFERGEQDKMRQLVDMLRADGLIVHVNPMQEAMQPEGDVFKTAPLHTLERLLAVVDFPIIVKEVGQGMGPGSLRALLQLPLAAVEFAAAGGTNFARLELLRSDAEKQIIFENMPKVGHSAPEMLGWANEIVRELGRKCQTRHLVISGGIRDFLDGYYLIRKAALPAVYGQASGFLKFAQGDYHELRTFVQAQVRGLELAHAYLQPR